MLNVLKKEPSVSIVNVTEEEDDDFSMANESYRKKKCARKRRPTLATKSFPAHCLLSAEVFRFTAVGPQKVP